MVRRYTMLQAVVMAAIAASLLSGCGESPVALLASSKEYLAKKDNKAAIIQLKNALQKDPELAEARFLLGKALLESGDAAGAEKELRTALYLNYSAEQVAPLWARSLVVLREHKKIIEELAKVELSAPEGKAILQTAIGESHLALKDSKAAQDAFAAALAAQPDYAPAHVGGAQVALILGDPARAISMLDAALSLAPADADAWQLKGDILASQKKLEPALAAYDKAVQAKPDLASSHAPSVTLLIGENRLEDAAKRLNAMKQVAPKHPQTLYLQALLAFRQKNFAEAREFIQQQLQVAAENPAGLLLFGAIEVELKSYAQAQVHLLKVLARAPGQRMARRLLIRSYLASRQPGKALDALKPVLGSIDKDVDMLSLAGEVFMFNGEPRQAADYFAKAVALSPGDGARRTSLALSRVTTGDADRAFRELEQAAATDPGIRGDLGLIATYIQRREYDKALAAIARLEKKQPESPMPHNLRALALLGKRDIAGARRRFEHALKIDPTYFPAAASLAQLDLTDKKPAEARQRFESILAADAKNMLALLALASPHMRTENAAHGEKAAGATARSDAEGLALINRALAAHPAESAPRIALISYYLFLKDPQKAAGAAQQAIAAMPDRPEILEAAGRAYQAAGEPNQALVLYKKLASLQPGAPLPYLRMAEVQVAANNKDDALESLRKALNIQPQLIEAQRGLIELHVDAGRLNEAIAIAREVQKQRPKEFVGYVMEGDIHASQKKWTDAATAYRAGLASAPASELAIRLHNALAASGGADAERFAIARLEDHPNDNAFTNHLAQRATARGEYRTAVQHYRRLLDSHPNNAVVLNNLAWAEWQLKDPKAIPHAEQANKIAPNEPAIMDTLGVLLIDSGDTARGLDLLKSASAMAPQAAGIRLNLAKALLKAGQKEAARKELDVLSKLGDKFSLKDEVARLKQGL